MTDKHTLVERLEHCSANTRDEYLHELAGRAATRITALEAREAELVGAVIDCAASLKAAISLLERGGKSAKKAAPSDKMFDLMVADYKASLERARATLAQIERKPEDGNG